MFTIWGVSKTKTQNQDLDLRPPGLNRRPLLIKLLRKLIEIVAMNNKKWRLNDVLVTNFDASRGWCKYSSSHLRYFCSSCLKWKLHDLIMQVNGGLRSHCGFPPARRLGLKKKQNT